MGINRTSVRKPFYLTYIKYYVKVLMLSGETCPSRHNLDTPPVNRTSGIETPKCRVFVVYCQY